MIEFYTLVIQLFPTFMRPFVMILMSAFIAFTIVNVVLTIIWVFNQIKGLFLP